MSVESIEKYLMIYKFHKISSIISDYSNRNYYRDNSWQGETTLLPEREHAKTAIWTTG